MRSLLYKDLINMKQQARNMALVVVIWMVISLQNGNLVFLGGLLAVYAVLFPITAYAFDEKSGWDKYGLALAYTRKQMVISRYLLGIMSLVVSMALVGILGVVIRADFAQLIPEIGAFIAVGVVILSLTLPVVFKLGVEQGRLILMAICMLPILIGLAGEKLFPDMAVNLQLITYVGAALPVVLLPASVWISLRIYEKKEF